MSEATAASVILVSVVMLGAFLHLVAIRAGRRPRFRDTVGIMFMAVLLIALTGWCSGFPGPIA